VSAHHARVIQLVHSSPGRLRLRLGWLRSAPAEAEPLAQALAALDASMEVRVRSWTGSVLCEFDPERLDAERIVAAARRHSGVAIVIEPGERMPAPSPPHGEPSVRNAVSDAFREMNRSVLHVTEGRLDLGALTGLGFLAAGALEVAATRRLPAPPWFNLAWWAFRTFQLSSARSAGEEEAESDDAAGDALAGEVD
jgi:hypothetical protein